MARWRAVVLAVAAAATAAALGGCSSTPAPPASKTPALPTNKGTASQREALLSTADLRAIPGAPAGLGVDAGGLYEDPNQIAPCGEKLAIPASSKTAIRPFGTTTLHGFQLIVDVSVTRATAFITAWEHDTRPGCPPSSILTNTGSTQTQVLAAVLPLPSLVDQETGSLLKITNAGHTFDVYGLIMRARGRIEFDALISLQPLTTTFGEDFALKAETKLDASLGIPVSAT
jgi:hypothetical protein